MTVIVIKVILAFILFMIALYVIVADIIACKRDPDHTTADTGLAMICFFVAFMGAFALLSTCSHNKLKVSASKYELRVGKTYDEFGEQKDSTYILIPRREENHD